MSYLQNRSNCFLLGFRLIIPYRGINKNIKLHKICIPIYRNTAVYYNTSKSQGKITFIQRIFIHNMETYFTL